MDGTTNRSGSSGEHIWLRYATQFSQDGRTYTIEMGIPVPLGASAEVRAQLIQEAQAGMDQLASHVEKRVAQSLKRGTQNVVATGPTASPPPSPRMVPAPVAAPAQRSAALPAPQTAPQPASAVGAVGQSTVYEAAPERASSTSEPVVIPPTRPSLSASMPLAGGNDLKLPQFIQQIRDELSLNPQEAMKILKVKSLSTGINLRDALEQLRRGVASGSNEAMRAERRDETSGTGGTGAQGGVGGRGASDYTQQKTQSEPGDRFDRENAQDDIAVANTIPMPPLRPAAPTPIQLHNVLRGPSDEDERESARAVHDGRPVYIFDEEEEEQSEEDVLKEDELLEDLDEPLTLSTQDRVRGRTQINRLRESRGSTTANSGRLSALNNVAISQVGEEQFQELIEGIWGVTAIKKLKVDQVEALISWAKEDDFVSEADAVLLLLEEERYARGNR